LQAIDALQGIGWGAVEVAGLWELYEAARSEEDKAKSSKLEITMGGAAGGQGAAAGGAGALALGVLSRVLTTLHLLYEVRPAPMRALARTGLCARPRRALDVRSESAAGTARCSIRQMHSGSLTHFPGGTQLTRRMTPAVVCSRVGRIGRGTTSCVSRARSAAAAPLPASAAAAPGIKASLAMQSLHSCVMSIFLSSCSARLACASQTWR